MITVPQCCDHAVSPHHSHAGNIIETAVRGAVLGGLYRVAVIAGEKTGATKQLKKALRLD